MKHSIVLAKDFCERVTDGTHDSPKNRDSGEILITSKNISRYGIDFSDITLISKEEYEKINRRSKVEKWDILFSMIGTIGSIYLETSDSINYACKNMGIFKMAGNELNAKWLFYYLQSSLTKRYIHGSLRGTNQGYVALDSLRQLPVWDVDEENKKTIVDALWNLDEKIRTNLRMIEKLTEQATAIFEEMFIRFEKNGGKKPDSFEFTKLKNVTKRINVKKGDKECVVLSAVNSGILKPSNEYFNKQVFSKDTSKYLYVPKKAFAYNPARINIGSIGLNDYDFDGCVSPVYVVFGVEEKYLSFFRFYFRTQSFKSNVKSLASGSVRQTLNYDDFGLIELLMPDLESATKFDGYWKETEEIIVALKSENDLLEQRRDTLINRFFEEE